MVSVVTGRVEVLRALDNLERRAHGAARKAVSQTVRQAQLALRGQVNAIFTRNRKAGNAIRSAVYDNRERGAAGLIWSRFGRREGGQYVDFLAPYMTGRDILPKQGRFLAIPLQRRRGGRKNARPDQVRGLEPAVIDGRLYLIKRRGKQFTIYFELVQRVRIAKRLDVTAVRRVASGELIAQARREWKRTKAGAIDQRTVRRK